MPYWFKSVTSRTIRFSLIGIFAVGLLIGAIRLALPFADLFRSELEGMLAEFLGMEVQVGRLEVRLAGLAPRLRLRDTVLLDPRSGRPRLSLPQLWVDLDPIASLGALAPRIESVTLVGARLVVRRLPTGTIVVTGLEDLTDNDPEAMDFFLGHGRFQLVDSDLSWIDEQLGAPPLRLSEVQVHLQNQGERHRIDIRARQLDDRQSRLRLVGDLRGEPRRPADWSGALYLQWQGSDLGQVLAGWLPAGLRLESDRVELESWNRLEAGLLSQSLSRIRTVGLDVWTESGEADIPPLRLDRVEGLLRWRRVGTGWRLAIKDLALLRDRTRLPVSDLGLRFAAGDDGGWTITGGNRFLDLTAARDLLTPLSRFLPGAIDRFDAIRPGGGLHDLRFRFVHRPELPPRWAASARVEDLSLDAHGHSPGVRGLTTELAANERAGRLVFSGADLSLDLPRLFPHPLRFDTAAGEVRWQRESDGALRLSAREITADNADLATRSRFSIRLPADGGGPFLDLHTEFRALAFAKVPDYLPSNILREELTDWLEHAFVGGSIPHGALLFRGAVADFPFDARQGRFRALFAVRDCTLNFHRDWPPLTGLVGEVHFEDRGMRISLSEGQFLDSDLIKVSAHIPDLDRAVAVEVQGRAQGPFADHLRILGETPLRKRLGGLAQVFKPAGKARLDLDLAIPLREGHPDPLRLAGELSWPGPAALAIPDQAVELTELAGKLRFTDRDLQAQSIEAKLWGVPVRLGVATRRSGKNAAATTHIRVTGRFPTAVLARQFPAQAWELLQGRARLALDLTLTGADLGGSVPPLDFELTSDLAGLALALPAPLGKPPAGTRQLRLAGRLAPEKALRIQGAYGDLGIALALDRNSDGKRRLVRGAFNLGGPALPLPEREGVHLGGSVAALDLRPWLDWWADQERPATGDPGRSPALHSARVRVGSLRLPATALNEVRFELEDQGRGWAVQLNARELEGKITVPRRSRGGPIRVRFARLDLKGLFDQEPKDGKVSADKPHPDPRQARALDLGIERLLWGNNPLGRVTLRSQMEPGGLEFTQVSLTGPVIAIKGRGSWRWKDAGPRSNLSLTVQSRDLGEFLRSLEFKSLLHKTPAELNLNLGWPGAPDRFSAADLKGRIRFELGAGSLLEVEPGVGRVLGILNLDALRRRLSLDFNDLFGPGYAFEKISGRFHIEQGSATTRELLIEGPSADVSIAGSTDLVERELDQIVTVTPHIGTGAAIAGAVAGGPLVGAAVFLVDQVSDGAVDRLGRHQYHLSGPWAEPEIRRGGQSSEAPEAAPVRAPKHASPASQDDEDENLFLGGD
ncbi:YhdP family protein [Candidatus Thiosymbion oneisti]|uniref:YhdP family protein n=1 Tax=Candidatus Thiosymbion oneisti TaxID=589554 RepID=UPI00105E569C|nr:YhdP family protein [Candidatus Thiosymbion oneisti]